ncbi:MAG: hypothetical protein HC837_15915 [Chloroflexaceae bacterium]|nr:hypothetical protein [Chloroflexaceae bacterium]
MQPFVALPGHLFSGATYPLRALAMLTRKPYLWQYLIIPLLINAIVGLALYAGLLFTGLHAIDRAMAGLPEWSLVIKAVLMALLIVGLFILTGFIVLSLGTLLGAPWYIKLSEHLEQLRSNDPLPVEPLHLKTMLYDFWITLSFELHKLLLLVFLGIPAFLLNFIPVVGPFIGFVAGLALGCLIVCLDFFDPPLSRRRVGFRTRLSVIRRSSPASLGFGLVSLGLVSIPLLNLIAIPICIAAGTLFFVDYIRPLMPDVKR